MQAGRRDEEEWRIWPAKEKKANNKITFVYHRVGVGIMLDYDVDVDEQSRARWLTAVRGQSEEGEKKGTTTTGEQGRKRATDDKAYDGILHTLMNPSSLLNVTSSNPRRLVLL